MKLTLTVTVLSGIAIAPVFAQTTPAPVLEIIRESIKEGRTSAHEKVESDWAAAFRKANFPGHYIGMTAISGPAEAWFVEPMPSFAAAEEYDKAEDKEPLKTTLALMDSRDGELRTGSRTMWAVYRPDLSYHPEKFNGAKTRFVALSTMRIKFGLDADFAAGTKTYFGGYEKGNVDMCVLAYQLTAGAPSGTYVFFTMMDSMKFLDGESARTEAMLQAAGPANFAAFMKSAGDMFISSEDTLLKVSPAMSYAPKEMVDGDPAFWKPKAAAPAAPAEKKPTP